MFDVTIEQPVLMKALEYLEPTVGKNINGLGDNCVSMRTTGNGSIEMYTTNTIECTAVEAIVSLSPHTVEQAPMMDFKRLKAIVATIPENEMIKMVSSVNDLNISFGLNNKPLKLVGCNNGMIPLPTNTFSGCATVSIPKTVIVQALNRVCAIVTDSAASPIYNCVRIATTGQDVEVTALDVTCKRTFVQMSKATGNNPAGDILVEASKMKKSMKLFEDYNEINFTMDSNIILIEAADPVSQMSMKSKGMITNIRYFCRRLGGNFPTNIKKNFYPLPPSFMEVNTAELMDCLSRVKAIEDQTSANMIGFEVDGGNVTVTMNTTHGNLEEVIPTANKAPGSFKTVFKYPNLIDILKTLNSTTFEIAVLPSFPMNYVVRATGQSDVMFTVPSMNTSAPASAAAP